LVKHKACFSRPFCRKFGYFGTVSFLFAGDCCNSKANSRRIRA
jgi:hypothetical protein